MQIANINHIKVEHKFTTYLRTIQFKNLKFKGNQADSGVFVKPEVLKFYNLDNNLIKKLIIQGEIALEKPNHYKVIKAGCVDFSLLPKKHTKHTILTKYMQKQLLKISLSDENDIEIYFKAFLIYRDCFLDHFFSIDEFSGRIHTPVSSLKRENRIKLLIDGAVTSSIDICTTQPLLLGKLLKFEIGNNEFSNWIDEGVDTYEVFKKKLGLNSRDEGKNAFMPLMYGKPKIELERMFNNAGWIKWINHYKSIIDPRNPSSNLKPYSNLAWILQKLEVHIMSLIWQELMNANISFLTVHDEVIVPAADLLASKKVFDDVLSKEFSYYKLNIKSENPIYTAQNSANMGEKFHDYSLKSSNKNERIETITKEELISLAVKVIGPFNNLPKDKIPFFEELLQFRIIEEGLNNNFYLSNSTPF